MIFCSACKKPVRWYHRKSENGHWHRRCYIGFEYGHDTAFRHCTQMNREWNLPLPKELYLAGHSELSQEYSDKVKKKLAKRENSVLEESSSTFGQG